MNYEVEINNLKARMDSLQDSLIQMGINNNDTTEKAYEGYNKANALEPYTDTKTAYIGDTEVTFENVPHGNVSVFGLTEYAIDWQNDRIIISFPAVEEVTDVTISVQ